MHVEVLLNDRAGLNTTQAADVRHALDAAGVTGEIRSVPGDQITRTVQDALARGVDAVVAGGGDGTVSAVAHALAGTRTPLGVLPLGTLNHFAKDNNIPLDLAEAVHVLATGRVAALDIGAVNDRTFINNCSLGVYAEALVTRDEHRERNGLRKWPAMALACLQVFRRSPMVKVRLEADGVALPRKTPLVFVGNNEYELELFRVGKRSCLNAGKMSLYVANVQSRWGMIKIVIRGALGRLSQAIDFETSCVQELRVESRRSTQLIAIDGEITRLPTPLEFNIRPRALLTILPPEKP